MAQANNNNNYLTWIITAATTVDQGLQRIERAWRAGQIARQNYERAKQMLLDIGDRSSIIYENVRNTINDMVEEFDQNRNHDGRYGHINPYNTRNNQIATREPTTTEPRNIATRAPNEIDRRQDPIQQYNQELQNFYNNENGRPQSTTTGK